MKIRLRSVSEIDNNAEDFGCDFIKMIAIMFFSFMFFATVVTCIVSWSVPSPAIRFLLVCVAIIIICRLEVRRGECLKS